MIAQDAVSYLGVLQHSQPSSTRRFASLMTSLQSRLALWRYRASTLQGRAILLRSIALSLLWYPAAVTPLLEAITTSVWNHCKAFLFQQPLNSTTACRGPMAEDWLARPPSHVGLGLPCLQSFSRAIFLCTLRDGLRRCSALHAPRWFRPAISLMTTSLKAKGVGLDILYSPIHLSRVPQ
uniref:AlNc14C93G5771 protein n=1 Tax=Albugo laibachii Nc14 TaxID=890382 RepID=F0WGP4_9STRA|nr:AlNc14C93G5771 [Albugo laibachii Nc14]|eukprot:CCA20408.1 AlNc14C93G5771 [Albugo laibachii Nc14]